MFMRKGGRIACFAFLSIFTVVLTLSVFGVSQAYFERRQAERFLVVLQHVQVGSTDRVTVLQWTNPFRTHIDESIHDGLPELSFSFDNRWIARLKFAPFTDFRGWITFKNGVVVQKSARVFEANSGCAVRVA